MTAQRIDEETPLITSPSENVKKLRLTPTPLPRVQISILLLLQLCEPIMSQSIYPYINQLISELDITGGDERRVGYYAGLIESLFFVTEAMFVLPWSRASDRIGRKPILLVGLAGSMISMLLFGLSKTFWTLVISRCLTGLLNGNIGVMKSTIGDLTDSTNRAQGVSMLGVVWSLGATLGPLIGGTFAKPHERFPKLFTSPFWREFPYFLPSLVGVSYVFVASCIAAFALKETVPKKRRSTSHSNTSSPSPLPLHKLFTYRVLLSVSNYVALAFLNISFTALFPLFLAMPVAIGGLGLPPSTIGYLMGSYGFATGLFQLFYFARITRALGSKRVVMIGMLVLPPMFVLLPTISLIARTHGGSSSSVNALVWAMVVFTQGLGLMMDMSYGAIFMYITTSPPTKSALGATHGLSQTSVSIARALGPAVSTSLFSLSAEKKWMGGYAVYLFFAFLALGSVGLARLLPEEPWEEAEDEEWNESGGGVGGGGGGGWEDDSVGQVHHV